MIAIFKKELNAFFTSPIGYLVIAVFLVINGLFFWVFKNDFNILNAGFADLNGFFFIAPWFLLFLIPAITMRSFSDEFRLGTIEILKTKPIGNQQIVLGKFLGALVLIILAIAPTLVYVYSIHQLGNPVGNLDWGTVIGSYMGLCLLSTSFTAIGLFTSTLSNNQIVAFVLGILLSFIMYYVFGALANLDLGEFWRIFGMEEHYISMGRGILTIADIAYFISVTSFFLVLTYFKLKEEK